MPRPRPVTIGAGGSQSEPFPVPDETKIAGVWIPKAWTPGKISFRYSPGYGEEFCAVHDTTNRELLIDASGHTGFSPTVYLLADFPVVGGFDVLLLSGDETADLPQVETVTCYILWGR